MYSGESHHQYHVIFIDLKNQVHSLSLDSPPFHLSEHWDNSQGKSAIISCLHGPVHIVYREHDAKPFGQRVFMTEAMADSKKYNPVSVHR